LGIGALAPVCIKDAPYISIAFGNQPQFNGLTAFVTFSSLTTGQVVGTATTPYIANSTAVFVYPGATVDAAGNATDWPGWRFEQSTQLWVPDDSDAFLRDGIIVSVTVNPSASGIVQYPPSSSACANPTNLPPPPTVFALPPTA
jgi:hypothetical protein